MDFTVEPGVEYFLTVSATLKEEDGLVPAGTILAAEQFELPIALPANPVEAELSALSVVENGDTVRVSGNDFEVSFDKANGLMTSFVINEQEMLLKGPEPSFWRAPIDNDFGNDLPIRSGIWKNAGKNRQVVSARVTEPTNGQVQISFVFDLKDDEGNKIADYTSQYLVKGNSTVEVDNHFKMTSDDLPEVIRIGMTLIMPETFNQMSWLGRGPHESYQDRKTSAFVDLYSGPVADQYFPYVRPQENGNKTDVRWLSITNDNGEGLLFEGKQLLEVSAHHNLLEDFESPRRTDGRLPEGETAVQRHINDVKPRDLTAVDIDLKQMGVGGDTSWGAWTHEQYRLTDKEYSYGFIIKPAK
ncbi:beta-galactosidase [Geofilum rubicundum JCM 15548]|uniref:beta-galactosidase n=1 Tax=Geofilum rubicundum JCM 15548 TaxID=1236989 RepID=A0A0E9LSD2_9BACT|nr:beta-galactosidase domain 4-containing protein [Geofilum rubicundum]GAO28051.1 beta-galactosidase [Geofilum rubicundum JCM 15548]